VANPNTHVETQIILNNVLKHSIASVSLSGTLKEKMFAVAKAGYDGIELFENDLTVSDIRPAEFRKMAADLGIEIVAASLASEKLRPCHI
jgi:sugar phosphate isomerase/epimerase